MKKSNLEVGSKVAYARAFLRSIACYTGSLPMARGVIVAISPCGDTRLATVSWNNDAPARVNVANLCRVGSAAFHD